MWQVRSLCGRPVSAGDDSLTLPLVAGGASGVGSVAANVGPEKVAAMCNEFDNRNLEAAQAIHYELTPLFKALFVQTNPLPVKAVLAQMGLIKNVLRLPLTPLPADKLEEIQPVLEKVGIGRAVAAG